MDLSTVAILWPLITGLAYFAITNYKKNKANQESIERMMKEFYNE